MRISKHMSKEPPRWRSGRVFFYDGPQECTRAGEIEWNLSSGLKLVSVDADADELRMSVGMGASLHLAVRIPRGLRPAVKRLQDRFGIASYAGIHVLKLSAHDGAVWWEFMHSNMEWRASDPWWASGSFHPVDAILGNSKHDSVVLAEQDVLIPMPERSYKWHVKLLRREFRRPRAPFWPAIHYCYDAEALPGEDIGVPGKGENPWDIGDDSISAVSGPGRYLHDAIGSVVSSAMRSRIKYGGSQEMRGPEEAPLDESQVSASLKAVADGAVHASSPATLGHELALLLVRRAPSPNKRGVRHDVYTALVQAVAAAFDEEDDTARGARLEALGTALWEIAADLKRQPGHELDHVVDHYVGRLAATTGDDAATAARVLACLGAAGFAKKRIAQVLLPRFRQGVLPPSLTRNLAVRRVLG
jgi:hypothetical protein